MSMEHNAIRVAFITLGCKVNKYETDSMKEQLADAGFLLVEPEEAADYYVVNTCSVTNIAERKSRQMLRRVKKWNPGAYVIAAGCFVNASHEKLKKADYVDILVGNNCKKEIAEVIRKHAAEHQRLDYYKEIGEEKEYEEISCLRASYLDHQRAYVKIQDGCNQFCSYCMIPYTRGRVRSREPERILEEIKGLAKEGVKEFVLTGIHISSYGTDFAKKPLEPLAADASIGETDNIKDLGDLVGAIAGIPEVSRIRLGSLEPRIITPELIEKIDSDKLCPHFHLSLQSACDDTLKRMNRHYTIGEFEDKCRLLWEHFDRPAITTDVIVGFPGETEEEFAITLRNLERLRLYEIHVFKYSVREGTVAGRLPNQVDETVKNERSDRLLALTKRQKAEYEVSLSGMEDQVLVEEQVLGGETEAGIEESESCNKGMYIGHTKRYVKVCVESDKDVTGEILPVTMQ